MALESVSFRKFRVEPKKYLGQKLRIIDGNGATMFYISPNLEESTGTFTEEDRLNLHAIYSEVESIKNIINV